MAAILHSHGDLAAALCWSMLLRSPRMTEKDER